MISNSYSNLHLFSYRLTFSSDISPERDFILPSPTPPTISLSSSYTVSSFVHDLHLQARTCNAAAPSPEPPKFPKIPDFPISRSPNPAGRGTFFPHSRGTIADLLFRLELVRGKLKPNFGELREEEEEPWSG